jgi:hypothetical protein
MLKMIALWTAAAKACRARRSRTSQVIVVSRAQRFELSLYAVLPRRLFHTHDRQRSRSIPISTGGVIASPRRLSFDEGMGTKSREAIYGASVRHSAEQAAEARRVADHLACAAWSQRMLAFQGPAQPSPTLGDALNGGYPYLEVKCLGCETHQTVALNIVRRPKTTPIHELERYMRCKDCSRQSGRPFKRSHLVALRSTKISAFNPPSSWWPGER